MFRIAGPVLVGSCLSAAVSAAGTLPSVEPSLCPFDEQRLGKVDCGHLIVAQDRSHPEGKRLRLAYAIARASTAAAVADPVVFLPGGPGDGAVDLLPQSLQSPFFDEIRRKRDIVFLDQRGTGRSQPDFCSEIDDAFYTSRFSGLPESARRDRQLEALQTCHARLSDAAVDLEHYNSITSAADIRDLRLALGLPPLNLLGHSYGTRLGLVMIREHPQDVRSAVLVAVHPTDEPPETVVDAFDRSLRLVYESCRADADCNAEFPTLDADVPALLRQFGRDPLVLSMKDVNRFPAGRVVVDGELIAAGIHWGLYQRDFIVVLPLLVREARRRNVDVLSALVDALALEVDSFSHGLYLTVECFEQRPLVGPGGFADRIARFPQLRPWLGDFNLLTSLERVCDAWHPHRATSDELKLPSGATPVLMLAGEFDPITPPAMAERAALGLARAQVVVVPGEGHLGQIGSSDCTRRRVLRFVDDPTELPDDCIPPARPLQFITDVRLTPGIARLAAETQRGDWGRTVALLACLLVLLSPLAAWSVMAARSRPVGATSAPGPRLARWTLAAAALSAAAFAVGLAIAVIATLRENQLLLAFGVLPQHRAWFVLPWVAGCLVSLSIVFAAVALRRRWWTTPARLHYALAAAAGAGLVILMASSGLS